MFLLLFADKTTLKNQNKFHMERLLASPTLHHVNIILRSISILKGILDI